MTRFVFGYASRSDYLLDSGEIFTWGDGRLSQLGHQMVGFVSQPTPRCVSSLNGVYIIKVAAGTGHTVVLSGEIA